MPIEPAPNIAISRQQAFILRHTVLQRLPCAPELCLHLADEIYPLWHMTAQQAGQQDVPPPFWAFAWAGGQALARYLLDRPGEVTGKRVVDLASGCGLCAIAAMKAGAATALAADVDAFCAAAVALNAQANGVSVDFTGRDLLSAAPPAADVILAGDVCYERPLAERAMAWLKAAHRQGTRVLIGDPGRAYLPRGELLQLAAYEVPATRELEDREVKQTAIFTFTA